MRMTKKIGAMVLAAALSLSMALPAFAGQWILEGDGRWWYKEDNGTYPKNAWKEIGGEWYHFDEEGYMETGWIYDPLVEKFGDQVETTSRYYYLDGSGKMLKNQNYIGGHTDETGLLVCDELGSEFSTYERYIWEGKGGPKPPVKNAKYRGFIKTDPNYEGYDLYEYDITDYKKDFFKAVAEHISRKEVKFDVPLTVEMSRRDNALLVSGIDQIFMLYVLSYDKWHYDVGEDGIAHFTVTNYQDGV